MEIEKLGVPTVTLVMGPFESVARENAQEIGMSRLSVKALQEPRIVGLAPDKIQKLGRDAAQLAMDGLTRETVLEKGGEKMPGTLSFEGENYREALEKMEKYFLNHTMSDGFPTVPPTKEAVARMLEATDLPPQHLVGVLGNGDGLATVEKIAVNAVMAGCLPTYLPVIIAAVEAMAEPGYDLHRVQSTSGPAAPLLILSGPKVIADLNINDGFSTIGPGWRANSTIGRAIRLILINIGYGWPGKTDMKSIGLFAKFTPVMAENEAAYQGAWEPLRVVEGFSRDRATVSVMTANSLKAIGGSSAETYLQEIARAMKGSYNAEVRAWGEENLVILNPAAFDLFIKAKLSRSEVQKRLYGAGRVSCSQFARYRGVPIKMEQLARLPQVTEEILDRCKESMENLIPVVPQPEDIKIIVAGGRTAGSALFIDTWGFGKSRFTTRAIQLPKNWDRLVEKYKDWGTPVTK